MNVVITSEFNKIELLKKINMDNNFFDFRELIFQL